jgi:glycosyltransferase involved in cell wall biosynthesis
MTLAIIIPAYNEEALLGRCLAAVLAEVDRAGGDVEIVVVDNASTDGTRAVAERYRVRVLSEPKRGIVEARHRGFVETSGELVANIDADTVMPAGWISHVRDQFASHPDLVALSGPVQFDGLPWWQQALVRAGYLFAYPFYLLVNEVLNLGSILQGGNFVFRREAWLAAGGYDRSIDFYGEDSDVARRLRNFGKVKWTFALPMVASGRRFLEAGFARSAVRYAANFLSMTFLGRPFDRTHTDIRTARPADPDRVRRR